MASLNPGFLQASLEFKHRSKLAPTVARRDQCLSEQAPVRRAVSGEYGAGLSRGIIAQRKVATANHSRTYGPPFRFSHWLVPVTGGSAWPLQRSLMDCPSAGSTTWQSPSFRT